MAEKFTAWAIDTRSVEGHGLIGRFYFPMEAGKLPNTAKGCKYALFPSRALAREYAKKVYNGPGWNPCAVKVEVTIEKS